MDAVLRWAARGMRSGLSVSLSVSLNQGPARAAALQLCICLADAARADPGCGGNCQLASSSL